MNNKNFEEIKQAIYKIIKKNGSISEKHIAILFNTDMLRNYCIDQLKQDPDLSFFEYEARPALFCFKMDDLFYKPLKKYR
jgi:hypothetical protein